MVATGTAESLRGTRGVTSFWLLLHSPALGEPRGTKLMSQREREREVKFPQVLQAALDVFQLGQVTADVVVPKECANRRQHEPRHLMHWNLPHVGKTGI